MGIFRPWALSPPFSLINPPFSFLPFIKNLPSSGEDWPRLPPQPSAAPSGPPRTKPGTPLHRGHRRCRAPSPLQAQGRSPDPLRISFPATVPSGHGFQRSEPGLMPGCTLCLHQRRWFWVLQQEQGAPERGTAGVMELGDATALHGSFTPFLHSLKQVHLPSLCFVCILGSFAYQ